MPDTTLTSAEQVIAGVQAAYDRVKLWPEDRMRPSAVEELGPGFTDLLLLRNLVPDLLSLARAGLEAGKAEESMRERAALEAEGIGEAYGMDETGWTECSETIATAIRALPPTGV